MKYLKILACFTLLILISCKADNTIIAEVIEPPTANQLSMANSSNQTGMNIFKLIECGADTNYLISPLSINIALSMAYNGANGATADEIKSVLNLNNISIGDYNEDYSKLIKLLISSDSKVKLSSANSIWNIPTLQVETNYQNILSKYFSAESFTRDFSDPATLIELNNWVKDKTNGKIEKILERIKPNSVLFLVNAIYFKADWVKQFDKEKTAKAEFTNFSGVKSQVDMMYLADSAINCYSDEQIKAIDLKYGSGNYSMTIILPNEYNNVNQYINQMSVEKYNAIIQNMREKEAIIKIPKFKIEFTIELKKILKRLGMNVPFENADFSKITKSELLSIDNIIHKTFMDVDEVGTTAAAVTLIDFRKNTNNSFYFNTNRPFIIVLRENTSNSILFLGRINKL